MGKVFDFFGWLKPKNKIKTGATQKDYDALYNENVNLIEVLQKLREKCGLIRAWVSEGKMPKKEVMEYFKASWMPKHTPPLQYFGHDAVLNERFKQIQKFTVNQDLNNYVKDEFIYMAIHLMHEFCHLDGNPITESNLFEYAEKTLPKGWSAGDWDHLLLKSQEQRIAIAGAWMCAELDIRQYETTKEPVI